MAEGLNGLLYVWAELCSKDAEFIYDKLHDAKDDIGGFVWSGKRRK